ncbi:glycosyltransferase family 2 protein [Candidatus Magnetomonas plexicatena]|uniref:glycosyltransferase family 2 protein n=1 Tax=Candidatus Magnetomonas plexicatena TaxID=2552947 RepID=UPI00110060F0|nr:hypothetical protein E2O03_008250 [Nitrospirales bacterium LBB_01]
MKMKDTIVVMCAPTVNRMISMRAIGSVKETNLERTEFIVLDNNYDRSFHHPTVMNRMLKYGAETGKTVIFLDDDIEVYDYNWIERLHEVSETMGADIVSSVHTYEGGEPNHEGIFVCRQTGTWMYYDLVMEPKYVTNGAVYVPGLCSAVMFVKNPAKYYFDVNYKKYHHDIDICLQAWQLGSKVACALDMKIIHNLKYYELKNPTFWDTFHNDSSHFSTKWAAYIPELLEIPELIRFKEFSDTVTWRHMTYEHFFIRAERLKTVDKELSVSLFTKVATDSINEKYKSESFFHLYQLEGKLSHLENCLKYNPCHQKAKALLKEKLGDKSKKFNCNMYVDCRKCHLLT